MADFRFLARNDSVRLVTFVMAFKNLNGGWRRECTRAFGRTDVGNRAPLTFRRGNADRLAPGEWVFVIGAGRNFLFETTRNLAVSSFFLLF